MSEEVLIEVAPKPGIKDPVAAGLADDLKSLLGFSGVRKVASSKLYRLAGDLTPEERRRAGEDLLCDPVIEEVRSGGGKSKSIAVDVWFKPGVTDAVGESALKGLRDMGLEKVQDVRSGTRYRFWGLKNSAAAKKLALALFINPLIHEPIIHAD